MIYFLENHGPAKFSEIFLGEFDTPEAIWTSDMRRTMIQKIAIHLGDFKPRLMCNTRALYQVGGGMIGRRQREEGVEMGAEK